MLTNHGISCDINERKLTTNTKKTSGYRTEKHSYSFILSHVQCSNKCQYMYTSGSAARPVLVPCASRSALASYRKVTTCRCLCCACRGCAISADNLCLPSQGRCRRAGPLFKSRLRPCVAAAGQSGGCLDSYVIPQITAARPEAGNARH